MTPFERTWPGIPTGLKYIDIRLPGTFRELIVNRNFTNDEIGRIMRCIATDSDFWVTPRIEAEVFYYRKNQRDKNRVRLRVAECRKRKNTEPEGGVTVTPQGGVTVTPAVAAGSLAEGDTLSCSEKTPTNLVEKTPPIVPLEKSVPSALEKVPQRRIGKTKRERLADHLQQDLFALVSDRPTNAPRDGALESGQKRPSTRSGLGEVEVVDQDIESNPRASERVSDTREDAAWIPSKFAIFWERYPRKIGKASAQKAFVSLIKKQKDVELFMKTTLSSVEWWKCQDSWKKDKGKFIPYPATWLNRGSWADVNENNDGFGANQAGFLNNSAESDDELIRRMQGGQ